ncbi:MAG: cytochrome b N-terminal domain-containing protein, partial [Pseudomonadales bacterium]|nr:cytochrome b N-terminal domain-containing protein [Pseudomonadales bacterium]
LNPCYQLGALSFYFFWIVTVSGLYLFIFFNTSINGAFESIDRLTHEQWYIGGVMRSLHRYASDAMVVVVTLHLLREFVLGRFHGVRWFSWFSGVPLIWLMFAAGIGGYWLVWDRLAQYIAIATTEWIDWLPIFGDALSRNFLSDKTLSDRFFSLLVFLHIALPLFLLLGMFIHIKRIKQARSNPPRALMIGVLAMLIVLSIVKPAVSMGPADLSTTVALVDFDWFYLNVYPLLDSIGAGPLWLLLGSVTGVLALLPWMPRRRQTQATAIQITTVPAVVNPDNCNGCSWCYQDCPYEAITMIPHSYKPNLRQALVDPDLCTACGICEGSCPSATPFRNVEELISGIEIPDYPLDRLRKEAEERLAALDPSQTNIVVFGCDHGLPVDNLTDHHLQALSLPCIGMLPPSFADFIARKPEVAGVMITGCHPQNCYYRLGSEWTEQRFDGKRMPHLRTKAGKDKVRISWAGPRDGARFRAELDAYRADRQSAVSSIAGATSTAEDDAADPAPPADADPTAIPAEPAERDLT